MRSWTSRAFRIAGARGAAALFLGWSAYSLTGCSPEEASDNTPPDPIIKLEKSQGKYRFGVTDTIAVDFSEDIDTAGLAVAIAPSQGVGTRFQGRRQLRIFGTGKSSGESHFNINSPFSVTLAGIKDLDGNIHAGEFAESFQPYAWIDRDFIDSTFNGYDSLFASDSTWMDGSSVADSFVTEGRLDRNNNFGKDDKLDYKIMRLTPPDTLKVWLSCAKSLNLRLQIAGPFAETGLDTALLNYDFDAKSFYTDSTKSGGTLSTRFDADFEKHFDTFGNPGTPGIYVLRLSIPDFKQGFYRLGLQMVKRKKSG